MFLSGSIDNTIRIDWGNNVMNDSSTVLSVDWANRLLYDETGGFTSVVWSGGPGGRQLIDGSGASSLKWEGRELYDSTSFTALNWNERKAYATNGSTIVLNWANNSLLDSGGPLSIDWENRKIYNTNGATVAMAFTLSMMLRTVSKRFSVSSAGRRSISAHCSLGG